MVLAGLPSGDEHWFSAQLRTAVSLLSEGGKNAESANLLHELQARTGDDVKKKSARPTAHCS